MKRMQIGILGTGEIALRMAEAMQSTKDMTPLAVCSRDIRRAQAFRQTARLMKAYGDYASMLEDDDLDLIYIATPNSLHFAHASAALLHGKSVILEKPFCADGRQSAALIRAAEETGLFLFEAITLRHSQNFAKLNAMLASIGPIRKAELTYFQRSRRYDALLRGETSNVFSLAYAGGALMDLNVYNLHFAIGLFGPPKSAIYRPRLHENGVDLGGTAILTYPDMTVSCSAAKDRNGDSRVLLSGKRGSLCMDGGANGSKGFTLTGGEETVHVPPEAETDRFTQELAAFRDVYQTEDRTLMRTWLRGTQAVMDVLDALRSSADLRFPSDRQPT